MIGNDQQIIRQAASLYASTLRDETRVVGYPEAKAERLATAAQIEAALERENRPEKVGPQVPKCENRSLDRPEAMS